MSEIRASDEERERAVETLRRHGAAGRLDAGELEERLGLALAAKTRGDLARLTEDLPAEPARPVAPDPRPRQAVHACGGMGKHDPRTLVAISILLVAIWAVTGMGYFWPMWPMLGFAISTVGMRRRGSNTRVIGHTMHTGNPVRTR
jgi:hypothetical protein